MRLKERAAARLDTLLTRKPEPEEGALENPGQNSGQNTGNLVSLNFASWNQLDGWLRQVDGLRRAA
jgi:hypothetical protein